VESSPFARVAALAADQHGLFTRAQARRCGVADRTVTSLVHRGLVLRRSPTVFAVVGAPTTWRQEAMAAVLSNGSMALLSHRAAVVLHLPTRSRQRSAGAEVVIPHHRWRTAGPWLVHESRQLSAADRVVIDGIPVTSIDRTLIDVGRFWSPWTVGRLLDDAVMAGLTTYERFAERLGHLRRRGRPGIATARAVMADRGIDLGSPFEQRMARLLRDAGLPTPVRELHVRVGRRDYYVDFAYPEARLGIECDSSTFHTLPYQFEHDLRRQNDIVGTGMLLLRYTPSRIRNDPFAVADEIRRHLQHRTAQDRGGMMPES